jgi:hypothetical protein
MGFSVIAHLSCLTKGFIYQMYIYTYMSLKQPINIIGCSIKGHKFPRTDVNRLFYEVDTNLNSSCMRCHAPFRLLKRNDKTYRVQKIYSFR